jgi:hypothetical protein
MKKCIKCKKKKTEKVVANGGVKPCEVYSVGLE